MKEVSSIYHNILIFYFYSRKKYQRGYQRRLASIVYKFFDKKTASLVVKSPSGGTVTNEDFSNKELDEELHKPIIRKFEKRKVHSPFIDNIWGEHLADMQLISKFNKGFRFLLSVIDICRNMHGLLL